jgi:murein L,D-transpeptidase YafK
MPPIEGSEIVRARRKTTRGLALVLVLSALVFAITSLPAGRGRADEPERVDQILVEKSARRMTLLVQGVPLYSYPIALGPNPIGPKQAEGDGRTPEGDYVIDARNAESDFHLSLHISYPNERDRARAAEAGIDPGKDIMIHGIRNGLGWIGTFHNRVDWTDGCIAVSDLEMEQIWARVKVGTPVRIVP